MGIDKLEDEEWQIDKRDCATFTQVLCLLLTRGLQGVGKPCQGRHWDWGRHRRGAVVAAAICMPPAGPGEAASCTRVSKPGSLSGTCASLET